MTKTTPSETPYLVVRRVQQLFWQALKNKDRPAFEQLLANDFVSRSPGQPDQERSAFIDTLTGFRALVRSVHSDNLEVHVWGEIAVVTGVQTAQLELADGQVRTNVIAITNVFQWQQDRWLMTLTHAVSMD